MSTMLPEARRFRDAMALWPTGVAVVTGFGDRGEPLGFVVGSLCSVSLDPVLVSFCVQKTSSTWAQLRAQGRFSINFLSVDQPDLCRRFASGDPARRFDGLAFELTGARQPRLAGCCACLDVAIRREIDAGDHWLALCDVHNVDSGRALLPLVFARGRLNRLEPCNDAGADHFQRWEDSLNAFPFAA